jgi:hypothetical protein
MQHGHAPGDITETFLEAIDAYAAWFQGGKGTLPTVARETKYVPHQIGLTEACGLVWNCTDILPGAAFATIAEDLALPVHSRTYAAAARALLADLKEANVDSLPLSPSAPLAEKSGPARTNLAGQRGIKCPRSGMQFRSRRRRMRPPIGWPRLRIIVSRPGSPGGAWSHSSIGADVIGPWNHGTVRSNKGARNGRRKERGRPNATPLDRPCLTGQVLLPPPAGPVR